MAEEHIILFDGVCNLCNRFVRFIIKSDKKGIFKFASLQSEYACILLNKPYLPGTLPETVIYFEKGKIYEKSIAVLNILKDLGSIWEIFYVLILVPKPLRDLFYTFIAKRRYKIFGKKDECMVPTPDIESRFIEYEKLTKKVLPEGLEHYSILFIHLLLNL